MLKWAFIFLVVAVVAGVLGFSGVARASGMIAGVLFFVAILFFVVFVGVLVLALMAGEAIF
jgi:uncharacterized membrane protein YtjA (UPF0391 family)